jgi:hypothetical protein
MFLLNRFARFCAKPQVERRLIAEAAFYLAAARLLLFCIPFRRIAPRLARQPRDGREADAIVRADVRRAVTTAARNVPWQALCLPQAMAAKYMLARRGFTSTLRFGVGRDLAGDFMAHAWLEAGNAIVIGGGAVHQVTPIAQFR